MFRLTPPLALALAATMMVGPTVAAPRAVAEPESHRVTYTVTAEQPFHAEIYYRDTDPTTFADYSHNPYRYSPNVEADVGPDKPWVLNVVLADPGQWAMVAVTSGPSPVTPTFHCQLTVDGVVAATDDGPKGALCSVRHW